MAEDNMDVQALLGKSADADFLREIIGFAAQRLMDLEVGGLTGAGCGEKNPERLAQRNGYRERDWETRAGTVELRIPKVRKGSYCSGSLEPRRLAEKALAESRNTTRRLPRLARRAFDLARPATGSSHSYEIIKERHIQIKMIGRLTQFGPSDGTVLEKTYPLRARKRQRRIQNVLQPGPDRAIEFGRRQRFARKVRLDDLCDNLHTVPQIELELTAEARGKDPCHFSCRGEAPLDARCIEIAAGQGRADFCPSPIVKQNQGRIEQACRREIVQCFAEDMLALGQATGEDCMQEFEPTLAFIEPAVAADNVEPISVDELIEQQLS
jgi:hypothetical protein